MERIISGDKNARKRFKKLFYSDKWAPCSDEYKRLVIEHFEKIFNCK